MPTSTSFPSGHAASGCRIRSSLSAIVDPRLCGFRCAARLSAVAFSRVYTGVHYPSDVLIGASVGAIVGRLTSTVAERGLA